MGNFGRKQERDNGHLRVWATIKTHSVAAAHSHVMFCFSRWSLLTFSGQFWHFHTETKPSFVKLYQNFREAFARNHPTSTSSSKIHVFQWNLTTFATPSPKINFTLANSAFNFRQRSFWHTKRHRILHPRQGPLERHPYRRILSIFRYLSMCVFIAFLFLESPSYSIRLWEIPRNYVGKPQLAPDHLASGTSTTGLSLVQGTIESVLHQCLSTNHLPSWRLWITGSYPPWN